MGGETTASPVAPADRDDEAGFLMLALGQLVTIFAIWMALYPAAFGLPRGSQLATMLGVTFTAAGVVGFYLAFRALSFEGQPAR